MKFSLKCLSIFVLLAVLLSVPAFAGSVKPTLVVLGDPAINPGTLMAGDTGEITVTITNSLKITTAGETKTTTDTYNYGPGTSNGLTTPSHTQTTTTTSSELPESIRLDKVTLSSDGPVRVVSQSFENVGYLGAGDMAKFTFLVRADSNAQDGVYYLKFKVTTGDEAVFLNYPVRVEVDNSGVKMVLSESPKAFTTVKKSVVFDVFNLRSNGIKSVSVVPVGDEFAFKPVQEYIIGDIGAGEMYTVQFDVSSKNSSYNGNPQFKVVYKNGNNWHESEPMTVYADSVDTQSSASNANDQTLLYVLGFVGVAAVLLGLVYFFMRGKRAKK
ncbi:hypothetical protein CUJ83_06675 [Methanocella sp. CWC-04]|uniref:Uncharacterized protein n=1 Tax=Methanooceanicella nereidis TaxID=2052831 RepID=A0AAP2RC75_9EURY|nr:hypothetical protein [Methanocella sp. CWC-04]MCD1294683.1 hypothetical protein [Methanocella sp. CWC-04]